MPSSDRIKEEYREGDKIVVSDWTKLPFPTSWEEFARGVNRWLEAAWEPDWECPHCGCRFWIVLEPVGLRAASAWPGKQGENVGIYATAPIACARCFQVTPVMLARIFEPASSDDG